MCWKHNSDDDKVEVECYEFYDLDQHHLDFPIKLKFYIKTMLIITQVLWITWTEWVWDSNGLIVLVSLLAIGSCFSIKSIDNMLKYYITQ